MAGLLVVRLDGNTETLSDVQRIRNAAIGRGKTMTELIRDEDEEEGQKRKEEGFFGPTNCATIKRGEHHRRRYFLSVAKATKTVPREIDTRQLGDLVIWGGGAM